MKLHIFYKNAEPLNKTNGTLVASFFVALQKLGALIPPPTQPGAPPPREVHVWFCWTAEHNARYASLMNNIPRSFVIISSLESGDNKTQNSMLDAVRSSQSLQHSDMIAYLTTSTLFTPEAFATCLDAAQGKNWYVSGHDANDTEKPVKITFAAGKHWRNNAPPVNGNFFASVSAIREDLDLFENFKQDLGNPNLWRLLAFGNSRTQMTCMPAVWNADTSKPPPSINWQQLEQYVAKAAFNF